MTRNKLSRDQIEELKTRLSKAIRRLYEKRPNPPVPANIKKLEVELNRYRSERARKATEYDSKVRNLAEKTREVMLFGDPAKALDAVKKVEKMKPGDL